MTARQVYEYALVELNKREAPSLLLEDYNYFVNKAVGQYINKMYNLYEMNQQKADDLRVLKSSTSLVPVKLDDSTMFDSYTVELPDDYLHILNCVAEYNILNQHKCYEKNSVLRQGVIRLTSDQFPQILHNYYLKPTYKRPYYYITNLNVSNNYPVLDNTSYVIDSKFVIELNSENINSKSSITITTLNETGTVVVPTTPSLLKEAIVNILPSLEEYITTKDNTLMIQDSVISNITVKGEGIKLYRHPNVDKTANNRYGNRSKVKMEIIYGSDNVFKLQKVIIDYLRSPKFIKLTQDQLDEVEDTSQILEFPDYVCQEIINELVKLLLENAVDPRLQTHFPINQTILNPLQNDKK